METQFRVPGGTKGGAEARLSVRDVVTVGILDAVFIAVYWICGMILGTNPATFPFLPAVIAVPTGVVVLLLLARVPKRGALSITALVAALVFLLTGHWWPMPAIMLVLGVLVDIVHGSGDMRSVRRMVLAHVLFSVGLAIAEFGPLALFADSYMRAMNVEKYGMPASYFDLALKLYRGPLIPAMLALTAVGALLGALLGRSILARHFRKAGIA